MKISVCVKQVPDTSTQIRLRPDNVGIETRDVQWIISPIDELAVEEALRVREKHPGSIVTVLSAGPDRVVDSIRTALAMGADAGIHLQLPEQSDSFMTAKALAAALRRLGPQDLILTGKEAVDDGAGQVSQLLGEFLGLPCVTVVQQISFGPGPVVCSPDAGGGTQELIEVSLPAVVAAQKGLNQPRYPTALNILKAKKREVVTWTMAQLGVDEADRKLRLRHFELPPPKAACRFLEGTPAEQAQQLAQVLREKLSVL